jgi:hypothetical protein
MFCPTRRTWPSRARLPMRSSSSPTSSYNSFGGDGAGVQFFYAVAVKFPTNHAGEKPVALEHSPSQHHAGMDRGLLASTALPILAVTIATFAGLLFAAPLNFAAGNLLSIYSPKKRDFATFGRQNASQTTVLASLGRAGRNRRNRLRRFRHRADSTTICGSPRRCSWCWRRSQSRFTLWFLRRIDGIAHSAQRNAAGRIVPGVGANPACPNPVCLILSVLILPSRPKPERKRRRSGGTSGSYS